MSFVEERLASWKILLPKDMHGPVLTWGLSVGENISLARSFDQIYFIGETQDDVAEIPNLSPISIAEAGTLKYCMIAVDEQKLKYQSVMAGFVSRLSPSGYISIVGSYISAKDFFVNINITIEWSYWAFLPSSLPRIITPIYPNALLRKGLNLHQPGSAKSRIILSVVRIFNRLGYAGFLKRRGVSIGRVCNKGSSVNGALSTWLEQKVSGKVIGPIIYTGSNSAQRKVSALFITDTLGDLIVKVSDNPNADAAIIRETEALEEISYTAIGEYIPKIHFVEKYGGGLVHVQSFLQGTAKRQVPFLTEAHYNFLIALIENRFVLKEIRSSAIWTFIEGTMRKGTVSLPEISFLFHGIEGKFLNTRLPWSRVHGDFTPWNISYENGQCLVWDWEDSVPEGLLYTDIITFIFRQASLVGPWPGPRKLYSSLFNACQTFSRAINIDHNLYFDVSLKVWLINEYLSTHNAFVLELADFLRKKADVETS